MTFIPVESMDEVIEAALEQSPAHPNPPPRPPSQTVRPTGTFLKS
jgi:hypothetical protein